MISLKVLSTVAVMALVLPMVVPSAKLCRPSGKAASRAAAAAASGMRMAAVRRRPCALTAARGPRWRSRGRRFAGAALQAAAVNGGGNWRDGGYRQRRRLYPRRGCRCCDRRRDRLELRLLWRPGLLRRPAITTMPARRRWSAGPAGAATMRWPTACRPTVPTIRGPEPIWAMTACGIPARNRNRDP